ncbi:MAG TPA: AI-2E family transporter [Salinivirga sp.]|uniref:AI-2E family transporter n=1 Tax=Salinivirga sp. TaxID=1970192 RepID=UPI002B47283D|nr:AI-2E family transporter [Salinivirga sp.]HKK58929.1 AI-2E family transporter [Salinivirga sp.]
MDFLKKTNTVLFFLIAVYLVFYYLASFLIPLTFGIFLAMLILPLTRFLEKNKFNTVLSSLTSTFILFLFLGVLSYLFILQISQFVDQLPGIRGNIEMAVENLQEQIASATGVALEEQKEIIKERTFAIWGIIEAQVASFVGGILNFTSKFLLAFVYVFVLLLYRDKFMRFIIKMYSTKKEKENARDAINGITNVVYQYLWGRTQVMLALAVMYYITFLIFGLPFALLITLFGALITIIPYIGPLVSGLVPAGFALIFFEDVTYIVIFLITLFIIHLVESYFIEPYIVGKEVKLNALAIIIAVILGGIIWGVAGMILFVPIFATIKIASNHSDDLRPFGALLGR